MTAADADDIVERCRAASLLLPPESAFVGVTAAALHGIPLPPWITSGAGWLEVAYPPGVERHRIAGIRHRQWRTDPLRTALADGLRVLSPARTWFDLAEVLPPDFLLAAGDDVVRRRIATESQLRGIVTWAHGRRGVTKARRVLPLINSAAESPQESRVRYWFAEFGLPEPEVNVQIIDEGQWIARSDLVFRKYRVIVEYDGAVHLAEVQRRYDAKRRNLLQQAGWAVVVLTADDLRNPHSMVATVRLALDAHRS